MTRRQDHELSPDHAGFTGRLRVGAVLRARYRGPADPPHYICAPWVGPDVSGRQAVWRDYGGSPISHDPAASLRQATPLAPRESREVIEFFGCLPGNKPRPRTSPPSTSAGLKWRARLATQPRLLAGSDEVMAGLNPAEIDQAVGLIGKLYARGLTHS